MAIFSGAPFSQALGQPFLGGWAHHFCHEAVCAPEYLAVGHVWWLATKRFEGNHSSCVVDEQCPIAISIEVYCRFFWLVVDCRGLLQRLRFLNKGQPLSTEAPAQSPKHPERMWHALHQKQPAASNGVHRGTAEAGLME